MIVPVILSGGSGARLWPLSRTMYPKQFIRFFDGQGSLLGATLRRVQVTRLQNGTFFAELHLERGGSPVVVDARPSDSIAIALRLDAPIFVSEALFGGDQEDGLPEPAGRDDDTLSAEKLQRHLEQLRPEDFGKFTL